MICGPKRSTLRLESERIFGLASIATPLMFGATFSMKRAASCILASYEDGLPWGLLFKIAAEPKAAQPTAMQISIFMLKKTGIDRYTISQ